MSSAPRLVELRAGGPTDLPAVAVVMADAFDPRFGEAWTVNQCLGMLSLGGVWLTLAYEASRLAGFSLARAIAGDGELLLLGVRKTSRGRGIGAALLRSVISEASARDAVRLHLEVRSGNDAVHLYRAQGFAKVGERRGYYRGVTGHSFDAHTYSRDLSPERVA
jgi:ribosomal-protein-alanine N-acetyltransferase